MKDDISWTLLAKHLAGECSEEEQARIRRWREGDPTREALLEELRQVWQMTDDASSPESWDTQALWERVEEQTQEEEAEGEFTTPSDAQAPDTPAPDAEVAASPPRRTSARRSFAWRAMTIGAVVFVLATAVTFWLESPGEGLLAPDAGSEAKTFATKDGQRATLRLADDTRVQLNVDSRLTVPATFGKGRRTVELEGEAFFEVATDSARPFIVRTGEATTRVLGTAFDVNAYPDEGETRVVVTEGRVALRAGDSSAVRKEAARGEAARNDESDVVLTKRQMGRVLRGGEQVVREERAPDRHLAWMDGRLVFEEAPFETVVRRLERWYDLEISLETGTSPPPGHLNARFAEDQPLGEVLNVVATAFRIEYERHRTRVAFHFPERSRSP